MSNGSAVPLGTAVNRATRKFLGTLLAAGELCGVCPPPAAHPRVRDAFAFNFLFWAAVPPGFYLALAFADIMFWQAAARPSIYMHCKLDMTFVGVSSVIRRKHWEFACTCTLHNLEPCAKHT